MFMETEYAKSFLLVLATENKAEKVKLIYGLKTKLKQGKLVEEAVQLHVSMGVTQEMSIGHYLKDWSQLPMFW